MADTLARTEYDLPIPEKPLELDAEAPIDWADALIKAKFMQDGVRTLHHFCGDFLVYDGVRFARTDGLAALVTNWLADKVKVTLQVVTKGGKRPVAPTSYHQREGLVALAARAVLDSATKPHTWLEGAHLVGKHTVALSNGLLDLETRTLHSSTPAFFNLAALPVKYIRGAQCPSWLHFLESLWPQDFQSIEAVQEMMGYLIVPDNSQQKLFALVGPPRSGKGTIRAVAEAMLGAASVCKLSMNDFTTPFGLEPTIGKLLAVVPDGRLDRRGDIEHAVEQLLSRSGNDSPPINRKHKIAYAGDTSSCRFMLLLNELPSLSDSSGALAGRLQLVRTFTSFLGREDVGLFEDKLRPEIDGIFAWALDGWDRLRKRGRFLVPDSAQGLLEAFGEQLDKLSPFMADCVILDAESVVDKSQVYGRYKQWADAHGIKRPFLEPAFFKALGARAGVDCEYRYNDITGTTRSPDGKSAPRRVKGIRLHDVP